LLILGKHLNSGAATWRDSILNAEDIADEDKEMISEHYMFYYKNGQKLLSHETAAVAVEDEEQEDED